MNLFELFFGKGEEKYISAIIFIFWIPSFLLIIALLYLRTYGVGIYVSLSFYIYLILLSILLIVFLKRKNISIFLVFLISLELLFGISPKALDIMNLVTIKTYLPKNNLNQFIFHPTLMGIPNPEFRSKKFNHSDNGIRINKNQFDANKPHIAIFGGSSAYDVGLSDQNTWISVLDEQIEDYSISNNGVPGYSIVEHLIQTTFYLDRAGTKPFCAIYYFGTNDIRNYGLKRIDDGYSDFHLLSQYGNLNVRYTPNTPSPVFNLILTYLGRNELPFPNINEEHYGSKNNEHFEIISSHLNSIISLNSGRDIKTVFIGQILNKKLIENSKESIDWLPFIEGKDVWNIQYEFNNKVMTFVKGKNALYFSPEIESFDETDFLDFAHFSEDGAKKFVSLIKDEVINSCN
ncbi:SGNH/GDSL hydrolase family protein [Pelagibacterales bacterium SAG-MED38]|nr:SGNH/GDSL hydrolase family protein [Pelagibacterales bacterium SAG-MED38]MBD1141554.1 SGNH/GDSL hydrolase family protein [Pelagibacterales bacterium SAG-MED32]